MRLILSLAVLGMVVSATVPALAQNTTTTTNNQGYVPSAPVVYVPMYNSAGTTYYNPGTAGAPVYNNNPTTAPLPMEQMVAGKNAPSYTSRNNNAYTGFGADPLANADLSSLSPEQSQMIRAQREAIAQKAQAEYLASLQQGQGGVISPYTQGAAQMYNQFNQPQQQAPVQRRVLYKQLNNPLVTPPRLFNPDQ